MGKRRFFLFVLSALCLTASAILAENPLGRIAGTVRDQSGAVLPGSSVTLINEATNQQRTTISTDEGAFVFPQLPAGSYTVKIELSGFKSASYEQVKVNPGQEYRLAA